MSPKRHGAAHAERLVDYGQCRLILDVGVEFIATEDTGKTFPAGGVKLGMTISSERPDNHLKDISDDFLFSDAVTQLRRLTDKYRRCRTDGKRPRTSALDQEPNPRALG